MLKKIIRILFLSVVSSFFLVFQLPSVSHAAEPFLSSPHAKFTGSSVILPPPPTQPPSDQPVAGVDYVADELLVKFKEEVTEDKKDKTHEKYGSKKIKEFKFIAVDHVKLKENLSIEEAIESYMSDPDVEYAEPNIIYQPSAAPPSGNSYYDNGSQWSLEQINAQGAWDLATGRSDVIVGVIDTGVNYLHEDLINNIWINQSETIVKSDPLNPCWSYREDFMSIIIILI